MFPCPGPPVDQGPARWHTRAPGQRRRAVFEYQLSFSADGTRLLYTTWSDTAQGAIHERELASGRDRIVSATPGFYYGPTYSRATAAASPGPSRPAVRSPASSTAASRASTCRSFARRHTAAAWPKGGHRTAVQRRRHARCSTPHRRRQPEEEADVRVGLNGEGAARSVRPQEYVKLRQRSTPDGRWVCLHRTVHCLSCPPWRRCRRPAAASELSRDTKGDSGHRASSQDVGSYLHWSGDGSALHWMVGNRYFARQLRTPLPSCRAHRRACQARCAAGHRTASAPPPTRHADSGRLHPCAPGDPARRAPGTQEVIEDGTVLVRGDTIQAVGTDVAYSAGAA